MTKPTPFHLLFVGFLVLIAVTHADSNPSYKYSPRTSTSVAQRWLVPDSEFYKQTCEAMDYAVVGRCASEVTQTINDVDNLPHTEYKHFGDLYKDAVAEDRFSFAYPGAMVYSDVIGTEAHETAMQTRELCDEYRDRGMYNLTESDRKRLVDLYEAAKLGADYDVDDDRGNSSQRKEHADMSGVGSLMLDYIVGMKTKEEKKEALALLSGEVAFKALRPVFILINMFDDGQETTPGTGSGRIIAYDPVEDEIYKKNYTSSPDKHPLGDSWHIDPKLKITSGQLVQFAIRRENVVPVTSFQYGFDSTLRTITGHWLLRHAAALRKVEGPSHGEWMDEDTKIKAAKSKAENGTSAHEKNSDHPYDTVLDFAHRLNDTFRNWAVQWKEEGKENATNNLVKFYDGFVTAAKALNEDPEADIKLC